MRQRELRVSQREVHRMHVVGLTIDGSETVGRGAKLFGISVRQMKRLRRRMREKELKGCCMAAEASRRGIKRFQRQTDVGQMSRCDNRIA